MATGLVLREVPLLCGHKRGVGWPVPLLCGDKPPAARGQAPCCAGTSPLLRGDKPPAVRGQAQGRAAGRLGTIHGLIGTRMPPLIVETV
jgi:hypothetical protein